MIQKGVKLLVSLAAIYATVALYGLLRRHGIDVPHVIGICTLYGFGFYSLVGLFLKELSK